jgi:hypothetical protein
MVQGTIYRVAISDTPNHHFVSKLKIKVRKYRVKISAVFLMVLKVYGVLQQIMEAVADSF